MKDLLIFILKAIVQKPDKITVESSEKDDVVNFNLSVDKEDMGRVIGKNGKIIKAIRTVLRIKALKEGKHINLILLEQ